MRLEDFLHINRIVHVQFAEKIGLSRQHLSAIMHGREKCGKILAIHIENMTKLIDPQGYVTKEEMLTEYKRRKNEAA